MIKEALQYIIGLNRPTLEEIGGETYSDKTLCRVSFNPKAECIKMNTLTSLVDYIRSGVDEMDEKMLIQVISPLEVKLISMLDYERTREELVSVEGFVPEFRFGSYMDHESFLIALQAKFLPGKDRDLLLRFAGTVKNGTVAEYGDDGVTQKATIKKGIAGLEDAIVPNPVTLRPYRTFLEVEQPESSFIFRMKEDEMGGVRCALFEADGGAWKNAAMKSIREYLEYELADNKQFTVIS